MKTALIVWGILTLGLLAMAIPLIIETKPIDKKDTKESEVHKNDQKKKR